MLAYENVKDIPKLFRTMTSLDKKEFEDLCKVFAIAWEEYKTINDHKDESKGGRKPILITPEDKLFFILFYIKLYPLQEIIGYLFGMSQSQANYWIHTLTAVLKMALKSQGYLPERIPQQMAEELAREASQDLAIDGTERRRQRPTESEQQRLSYSGKKKAHTLKNDLIAGINDMEIKYLSKTYEGKKSDKKIADEEGLVFPKASHLYQDKAFQGYQPEGVTIHQPKKKPKGGELSVEEKEDNRLISRIRVVVEHVIAGVERCRIVKDVFRNTKDAYDDLVIEIACGLHNLRGDYRLEAY